MKKILIKHFTIAASVALVGCTGAYNDIYKDSSASVDNRVQSLLSQMTLEEKIGQLNQRSMWGSDDEAMAYFTSEVAVGNIGSLLNVPDAESADSIQRVAVEKTRLGIPLILSRDVIHGYKTIFPIPLGQAATFDTALVKAGARIAAIEASSDGIRWTFSPMIDIARDPRWGRIAEGSGEDVFLASMMARAQVEGYQGDDLSSPTSIAACAKHFVGYGASESGRDYNSTYIPERQLRNVYLPPFEEACKAGCLTYMSSFNDNDGIPASGNKFVLTDVLRGEWGFKGFVVSDWASVGEMVNHGFCADMCDAAATGFNAGVDMEMESQTYINNMKQLINDGKVSMSQLDKSVANILRVKFMLGLFENPYISTPQEIKYAEEHLQAAKQAAIESAVLLKNDNYTLPLSADKIRRVLLTGPLADAPHDQLGTWVFDGDKTHTVTVLDGICKLYGDKVSVVYEPGLAFSRDDNKASIAKAVAAAHGVDAIIAVVGEEAILSGEAHSLADLNLVGGQSSLIEALAKVGKPLVTVVMAGRPLTIGKQVDESNALLYSFHPGTMGGEALAELIFGKVSPSGKLPVTFPKAVGQIPIYYNKNNTGRPALGNETLLKDIPLDAGQTSLGCTSFWMDAGFGPLFPFGYGLSYGDFKYSDIATDKDTYKVGDVIVASATLTNEGKYPATEVAQLYIRDHVGSVTRPVKELKGFKRQYLEPGESAQVVFELPVEQLAFYGIDMKKKVEPGDFTLWIGGNSDCQLSVSFKIEN
ncbi:MAG: beta-glucosidase BglX [Muribaculaceae bacterium]|nr:beta-glucosidase BglX [Muribaculaceae bacterium]